MISKRDLEGQGGVSITMEDVENATILREINRMSLDYLFALSVRALLNDWFTDDEDT